MNKGILENIISKYIAKEASQLEIDELLVWLEDPENEKVFIESIEINHYLNKSFKKFDSVKAYQNSLNIYSESNKKRSISTYYKYAVAASIVLLISLAFVFNNKNTVINEPVIVNNNIEAGTNKAILTLGNGATIALEKGKNYATSNLSSNGEELIYNSTSNKKEEIVYNYLTVPRGGQYSVKLPDGTQVWLNSDSQIKYPVNFIEGETREVELVYGEAYFDVSPSTQHKGSKFNVLNQSQNIEVLGTEFNIKAYKDEGSIYTTLVEGSIALKSTINETVLKPEEQFVLNTNNQSFHVSKVNVYDVVSWKNEVFSFRNKALIDIAKVLRRWYDVDFIFMNKDIQDTRFVGVLSKKQPLEEILLTIKNTGFIESYSIKGKTIILN